MSFGYSIYFTERPKNRVIRWDPDTDKATVIAGEPTNNDGSQRLHEPYGLAFDPGGSLFVADKLGHRICRILGGRLNPVALKDLTGHRDRRPDGPSGFVPSYIASPTSLFPSRVGGLICSFYNDHTIYRIGPGGELDLLLGLVPNRHYVHSPPREFVPPWESRQVPICLPTGVVERSDGTLFFVERFGQVVREYHPTLGLRSLFPESKRRDSIEMPVPPMTGSMDSYHPIFPCTLTLDTAETLYVCDTAHGAVLALDLRKGTFERKVLVNRPAGVLSDRGPLALTFGRDGTAWLADSASRSIQSYLTGPDGRWTVGPAALESVAGCPLDLGVGGIGIVAGN